MKRRPVIKGQRQINVGNMVSKLRRLRTEVGLLLQQIDDALARIEGETA